MMLGYSQQSSLRTVSSPRVPPRSCPTNTGRSNLKSIRHGPCWNSKYGLDHACWLRHSAAAVEEAETEAENCSIAFVNVNNKDKYTKLRVEVPDYPGLLRVVAWVLNGMGIRVHEAVIKTTQDGFAQDEFWLTDFNGKKVYVCGDNLEVNNNTHPDWSQVTIKGEPNRPGFLLEIASLLSGMGFNIHQAEVQGSADANISSTQGHDFRKGRLFKFWVTDRYHKKLDYPWVSALTYTLGLVTGKGNLSLTPPNLNITTVMGESCAVEWDAMKTSS